MTADKTITCRDCGQAFVFSVREQEFFAERGFGDPVRCLVCRRAHKAKRNDGAAPGGPSGGAPVRDVERRYSVPGGPRPAGSEEQYGDRRPAPRRDGEARPYEPRPFAAPMPPLQEVSSRRERREIVDDGGQEPPAFDDEWAPKGKKDGKKKRDRRGYIDGDDDEW